jgi:hypothetical protein
MVKILVTILCIYFVETSYAQLLNCEMTRKTVFELIGSKKIEKRAYEVSKEFTDTIYTVHNAKICYYVRSVRNDADNSISKVQEGGWVGKYTGLMFENDTLSSCSWQMETNDTCILNRAKFEILFYISYLRMPLHRIGGRPNPSVRPKSKVGIIGGGGGDAYKSAYIVWYDGKTAYELVMMKSGISLSISNKEPRDITDM